MTSGEKVLDILMAKDDKALYSAISKLTWRISETCKWSKTEQKLRNSFHIFIKLKTVIRHPIKMKDK